MGRSSRAALDRTSFIGRSDEIAWLRSRVRDHARLVTILGPPGMGKTRILRALETRLVAKEVAVPKLRVVGRDSIADATMPEASAVFVDLTVTRSLAEIATAVGQAMGLGLRGEAEATRAIDRVGEAMASLGAFVVLLDNFEQVAMLANESVGRWLDEAPQATFVVTSRVRLRVPGEECFDMPPLPREDAARLFVDRARLVRADYQPNDLERMAIDELVTRLDGIPLAIELAAARVHLLSATQLVKRLGSQLDLLRRPQKGSDDDRQASLRAALDSSWSLLTDHERSALAQCASFHGPFSIDAAEGIVDLSGTPDPPAVLDVLDALRSHSLVKVNEGRCSLYESVREYAAEKLASSGRADDAMLRHARWFVEEGERLHRAIDTREGVRGLIDARDNLLAVVDRMKDRVPDFAMRAGFVLLQPLFKRGPRVLFDRVWPIVIELARSRGERHIEARAVDLWGTVVGNRGELGNVDQALARLRALAIDDLADFRLLADGTEAVTEMARGNVERALALLDRIESAPPPTLFHGQRARHYRSSCLFTKGDYERAEASWRAIYQVATASNLSLRLRAITLGDLLVVLVVEGRFGEAAALFPTLEEVAASIDEWQTEITLLAVRSIRDRLQGDDESADRNLDASYALAFEEQEATYTSGTVFLAIALRDLQRGEIAALRERATRYLAMCESRVAPYNVAMSHLVLAMCADAEGSYVDAFASYQRAIDVAGEIAPIRAHAMLHRALANVARDDRDAARTDLDAAASVCDNGMRGIVAGTIQLARAALSNDAAVVRRLRDEARSLLRGVDSEEGRFVVAAADAHFEGSTIEIEPRSLLARRFAQALAAIGASSAIPRKLRVARDGRWFEVDGNRIELGRRRALRLLVLALAKRHGADARGLTQAELLEAGWPGEKVDWESGAKRVYTSVNLLRSLGLREVLATRDDGYLILPEIQVILDRS